MSVASNTRRRASACCPVQDERWRPRGHQLRYSPESKARAEASRHGRWPRLRFASKTQRLGCRRRRGPDRLSLPPPNPSDSVERISSEFRKHYLCPTRCSPRETTTFHSVPPSNQLKKHSSDACRDQSRRALIRRFPRCESSSKLERCRENRHRLPPQGILRCPARNFFPSTRCASLSFPGVRSARIFSGE